MRWTPQRAGHMLLHLWYTLDPVMAAPVCPPQLPPTAGSTTTSGDVRPDAYRTDNKAPKKVKGGGARQQSSGARQQEGRTVGRQELPGSPFKIMCLAGPASNSGSTIEQILKVSSFDGQQGMRRGAGASSTNQEGRPSAKSGAGGAKMAGAVDSQDDLASSSITQAGSTPETNGHSSSNPTTVKLDYSSSSSLLPVSAGGHVGAGELIVIRPLISDCFGNPAAVKDGELRISVQPPDRRPPLELAAISEVKGGLTTYEARLEPTLMGEMALSITLSGKQIMGSPFLFHVVAGEPDVKFSRFVLPDPPLYATQAYDVVLICHDMYNNTCRIGHAAVTGRLQGPNMPPGQDTNVVAEDRGDGTYVLRLTLKGPTDLKLIVSIGRPSPQPNAEFAPINLSFISSRSKGGNALSGRRSTTGSLLAAVVAAVREEETEDTKQPDDENEAAAADGKRTEGSYEESSEEKQKGEGSRRLRNAAAALIHGMGARVERRPRNHILPVTPPPPSWVKMPRRCLES